jgi:hypothetical protein
MCDAEVVVILLFIFWRLHPNSADVILIFVGVGWRARALSTTE